MDAALIIIKKFEGLRLKAYLCPAGIWTIGYGSTRIDNRDVQEGDACTADEAEAMLNETVSRLKFSVRRMVKRELKQHEYDALISLAYNIGLGNFQKSSLLILINASAPANICALEFPRWNKSKGKVLAGLITRRKEEQDLFLYGQRWNKAKHSSCINFFNVLSLGGISLRKFNSRKLLMTVFSICMCLYSLSLVKELKYNYLETVVIIPTIIGAIAVMCAAYVTGQAKVDINQNNGVKKDEWSY